MVHKPLFVLYYIQFTRLSSNDSAAQSFEGSSTSLTSIINHSWLDPQISAAKQCTFCSTFTILQNCFDFSFQQLSPEVRRGSSTGCTALGNSQNSSSPGGFILSPRLHLVAEPITSYQTEQNLTLTPTSRLRWPSLMRITNCDALVKNIYLSIIQNVWVNNFSVWCLFESFLGELSL